MRCFEQPVPSPGPTKLANNGMHSSRSPTHTSPQAQAHMPTKASSANQWLYYCELCRSDILKRSARQEFEAARHERVWPSRPSPTPPPSIPPSPLCSHTSNHWPLSGPISSCKTPRRRPRCSHANAEQSKHPQTSSTPHPSPRTNRPNCYSGSGGKPRLCQLRHTR